MGKLDSKHRAWQTHLLHMNRVTAYLACVLDNPDHDDAEPPRDVLIKIFAGGALLVVGYLVCPTPRKAPFPT